MKLELLCRKGGTTESVGAAHRCVGDGGEGGGGDGGEGGGGGGGGPAARGSQRGTGEHCAVGVFEETLSAELFPLSTDAYSVSGSEPSV